MAMIKRRIMNRSRILNIVFNRDKLRLQNAIDSRDEQDVHNDILAHMLADGKEVKVYNDVHMGGMVVEYDDGT